MYVDLSELKKTSMFSNGFHYPPYQLPFMAPLAHPAMMNLAMASHLGMRPDVIHAREPHRDNEPADLTTPRYDTQPQRTISGNISIQCSLQIPLQ